MGRTWYCAFDDVGLRYIVGSGVLSGRSRKLAAVSSPQTESRLRRDESGIPTGCLHKTVAPALAADSSPVSSV
ncbi:hypothetical protein FQA47_024048 [Oryzias melastigma]|uniref:Uncharacterized protein n=1 Tax=Oryzias melastigma TaxID=30732 RepID=A0A834F0U3_ORYME|nr:hypothetical protein FQA47_024048 [Oryzias melastigma]